MDTLPRRDFLPGDIGEIAPELIRSIPVVPDIFRIHKIIITGAQPIESMEGFRNYARSFSESNIPTELFIILKSNKFDYTDVYELAVKARQKGDPRLMMFLGLDFAKYLKSTGEEEMNINAINRIGVFDLAMLFITKVETLLYELDLLWRKRLLINPSFLIDWNASDRARGLYQQFFQLLNISESIEMILVDYDVDSATKDKIEALKTAIEGSFVSSLTLDKLKMTRFHGPSLN